MLKVMILSSDVEGYSIDRDVDGHKAVIQCHSLDWDCYPMLKVIRLLFDVEGHCLDRDCYPTLEVIMLSANSEGHRLNRDRRPMLKAIALTGTVTL